MTGPMIDRASIIEKAARAMCRASDVEDEWWGHWLVQAEAALDAIAPPGEAWVAPWEATGAIRYVFAVEADKFAQDVGHGAAGAWAAMRDQFLSDKGKG